MGRGPTVITCAGIAASLIGVAGCGSDAGPRLKYTPPPTAAGEMASIHREGPPRAIVVLEPFHNPRRKPISWSDIGPGMSEALAQAMLNRGEFEVRIERSVSANVRSALEAGGSESVGDLRRIGDQLVADHRANDPDHRPLADEVAANQSVQLVADDQRMRFETLERFAILGQVTDFHHTNELPEEIGRKGLFGSSRRNEAVVAIHIQIVDLRAGRVLLSDHVVGTSPTTDRPTRELYRDIAFGSYLFWNTPLGRASHQAVEQCIARLERHLPAHTEAEQLAASTSHRYGPLTESPDAAVVANRPASMRGAALRTPSLAAAMSEIRIARQRDERWLDLTLLPGTIVEPRERFFVYQHDPATAELEAVFDPDMRLPLRAEVIDVNGVGATALLLGRKPERMSLRGAVLLPDPPQIATADESATEEG